jgi:hypothetical protein
MGAPGPEPKGTPVMLIVGVVLLLIGISGLILGIVWVVNAVNVPDDNAIARGTIGGDPETFEGEDAGRITVYLRSSSSNTDVVDGEVDGTSCTVEHSGGTAQIDGSRQSVSLTLGSTATIGFVDVEAGTVTVQCDGRSSDGDTFIVARGGQPNIFAAIFFIVGGALLVVGGLVLTIVGAVLRGRRRRHPPRAAYGPG